MKTIINNIIKYDLIIFFGILTLNTIIHLHSIYFNLNTLTYNIVEDSSLIITLLTMIIFTSILVPIFEEFVFRYSLTKSQNNILKLISFQFIFIIIFDYIVSNIYKTSFQFHDLAVLLLRNIGIESIYLIEFEGSVLPVIVFTPIIFIVAFLINKIRFDNKTLNLNFLNQYLEKQKINQNKILYIILNGLLFYFLHSNFEISFTGILFLIDCLMLPYFTVRYNLRISTLMHILSNLSVSFIYIKDFTNIDIIQFLIFYFSMYVIIIFLFYKNILNLEQKPIF